MFLTSMISAQTLQPIVGIHWTGGLSYDMEHEIPSAKIGLLYSTLDSTRELQTTLSISGNFYIDVVSEKPETLNNTYYVLRLQGAREILNYWSLTGYVGYVNTFDSDLMKSFRGTSESRLAWGAGIQTWDDYIIAESMYEILAGYGHLSIGVTYKLPFDLIK